MIFGLLATDSNLGKKLKSCELLKETMISHLDFGIIYNFIRL